MNLQTVINSAAGVGSALLLARLLPPRLGYFLSTQVANMLARRDSDMTKAIKVNQWVVSGKTLHDETLQEQTVSVLRSTARSIFDFYHLLRQPDKLEKRTNIPQQIETYFDPDQKQNALFVTTHVSNFDLLGLVLGQKGYRFQILSAQNPGSGYQLQNKIREESGHLLTPMSISALQQARIRLQEGGNVLTGLDRPIQSQRYHPVFFGHPSALPVAYTRLALQTGKPIIVVSPILRPDGVYDLFISDPIEMKQMEDPEQETLRNTEAVLEIAEAIIKEHANQWAMFFPVWPDQMKFLQF